MTIVTEDGTGLPDASSYVSTDFVDSYAAGRGYTSWGGLTQSQKEASVVLASDYIDTTQTFTGNRNSLTQGLQWPRTDGYDTASQADIPSNFMPRELLRATAELAIKGAAGTTLVQDLTSDQYIKSESAAGLSITYMDSAPAATVFGVITLLKGLVRDPDDLPPLISSGTSGRPGFRQGMFDIPGGMDLLRGGFAGPRYDTE